METIGRGGFGTVYRARMTDAGGFTKQVALKVLHYEGDAVDEMARRLRDEARVLGLIRHRAIVGVTGLVPLDQGWGVVMDFIDGVDLTTALKAGRLPAAVAVEIVEEVAAALDAAYTARPHEYDAPLHLIHRDIKPANLRITRQGEVKLLDFGVASAEFESREAADNTNFVMGSPRYMAPERRHGVESHRGDIYALGIVLANLLTGKRFKEPPDDPELHSRFAGTLLATVMAAVNDAIPSIEGRRACAGIRMLLLEMLAFEADDRPDGAAVARRLRRFRMPLPHPWLRDWADTNVPQLMIQAHQALVHETDTGRVFVETSMELRQASALTPTVGQPIGDTTTTTRLPTADPPARGPIPLWGFIAVGVGIACLFLAIGWVIWS